MNFFKFISKFLWQKKFKQSEKSNDSFLDYYAGLDMVAICGGYLTIKYI